MLNNMVTSLFDQERVITTQARAKELRRSADQLITFAKRGDLHARRQVLRSIADKQVVAKLFDELGPRYKSRQGGYTRIVKLGPRQGDGAPMSIVELIDGTQVQEEAALKKAEKSQAEEGAGEKDAPEEKKA
jgi:large subunit ribosomal protein L17